VRMGKMYFGGIVKEVCLAYVDDLQVGDFAIVHVGFAISQVDEASAQAALKTFAEMGLLDEEFGDSEHQTTQASSTSGSAAGENPKQ